MFGTTPSGSEEVLLFTHTDNPRLRYVLHILFGVLFRISYRITRQAEEWLCYQGPRLYYGNEPSFQKTAAVCIPSVGLLDNMGIEPIIPTICSDARFKYPGLFPVASANNLGIGFDLLSMVFFLVTRYEEYVCTNKDEFGRMPASESWQYKLGVLEYPLVDYWGAQLIRTLQHKWPGWQVPERKFSRLSTFDIDIAWAFLHRPWWRQLLSVGRDIARGKFRKLLHRWRVWCGRAADPYATYELLLASLRTSDAVLFFFLLSDYARYEPAISYRNPTLRALVQQLAKKGEPGIHPSLASHHNLEWLIREKTRLEKIIGTSVVRSRQHFLSFSLPETYRRLERAGIEYDFSMGYPEYPGFRAGISVAFPWYDLVDERMSSLMVQPFQVMDVTMKQYQGLSVEAAIEQIERLEGYVEEVRGTFCILWHNSSFYGEEGWDGWELVFHRAIGSNPE